MVRYYLRRRLRRRSDAEAYGLYRITHDYDLPRYEIVEDVYEREGNNGRLIALVFLLLLALAFFFFLLRELGISEEVEPTNNGNYVETISVSTPVRMAGDERAQVIANLPWGRRMLNLAKSHTDARGEVWVKVRLETTGGSREGWINQRDIR